MKKLFIPGPVEVKGDVLEQLSKKMIGHRSSEFMKLYEDTTKMLKKLLCTENEVILSTSSATGLWEACARNLIKKKCLCPVNGAFSEKWFRTIVANGKKADRLDFKWGFPVEPDMVDELLASGEYDAVALVHNETSTGVMNDLEAISQVVKKYPGVIFMVDCVSSVSAVSIKVDRLGIDVCLASVQKALAVPPGLSFFSLSDKAFQKSLTMEDKGYYFDFETYMKYHRKNQTISTPPLPQIYALNYQLKKILEEGPDKRYLRHRNMAELTRTWAKKNFKLFPRAGYESVTLTCIVNTKYFDVDSFNKGRFCISNGYGKLKGNTFRISHMGDITKQELIELLYEIDKVIL